MAEIIQTNKYQTPITEELLESLPTEVRDNFLDAINNIEFIKRLISPNRKYARDLPKDNKGRVIVDICNPHILEDMEYFRPTGNYFREHGVITKLRPNANPNSEFGKWITTELNRIWYGMVRPSDGEWITGNMYFYLNYTPIIQTKIVEGTNQGNRIVDFPEIWEGSYLIFHYIEQARRGGLYDDFKGGKHVVEIAKRGAGKSYMLASILAKLFICGENNISNKGTRGVVTAYQKESLIKDGTLNKFTDIIDFCAEFTQFPSRRLQDSLGEMTWVMGYKDLNTGANKGTGNVTLGVTAKDNVEKSRGKRCNVFGYEEFGAFKNFIDIWMVNLPSVEEGKFVFGQNISIGTGGSKGSDFSGALEIIYSPKGYHVYALPNVFDRNAQGKQLTVFFFGAYLNSKGYYNKDGVSDIIGSLLYILKERYTLKYNSSDSMVVTRAIAENPITIQEAIMKRDSTIFPVGDLGERLHQLDQNPLEYEDVYIGDLIIKDGIVKFTPTIDVPIRDFPHKNNKLDGAIEIFKMPEKDAKGEVFSNRYIASVDPYDDDAADTLSLGSTFILDLWTDEIVAEYTGRPMFADDYYEKVRRLLLLYNARCNYENNKKGLFTYFSKMNSLYLLTDTLEYLRDKDMIKGELYGNKIKGTSATASINGYGRTLIRNWLLKPVPIIKNTEEGAIETTVPLLYKLRSRALIKELMLWNIDGNYDRVSSMIMLMLLREAKMILCGGDITSTQIDEYQDDLSNDEFFNRNYRGSNMNNSEI